MHWLLDIVNHADNALQAYGLSFLYINTLLKEFNANLLNCKGLYYLYTVKQNVLLTFLLIIS